MTISYGFLSTYPPTQCGLATFTASLLGALTAPVGGDRAGVRIDLQLMVSADSGGIDAVADPVTR